MIYAVIYLVAIATANLTIAHFGPAATIPVAFLLIGLDLTLRDGLHDAWRGRGLVWKMALLIGAGAALTWALSRDAGAIGVASTIAFGAAALADTLVYDWLRERRYLVRVNGSNAVGALVDSALFPTLAFGAFFPLVILGQFLAKTLGGFVWAWLLERTRLRHAVAAAALLACLAPGQAHGQDLWLTAHYDVARDAPITSAVYQAPLGPFYANGFVEVWRNTSVGYPASEWVLFSKHWVQYPLTRRLSLSLELEVLKNRPGVDFKWPERITYVPDRPKLHLTPKIGASIKIF